MITFYGWSCSINEPKTKQAKKVKSYIYCVNQFLHKKHHKKSNQECKQKQSLLFNFCNIFDLLIYGTEKIAWWLLFLNLIFTYFPIMNNAVKFKEISLISFYLSHFLLFKVQKNKQTKCYNTYKKTVLPKISSKGAGTTFLIKTEDKILL